MKGCEEGIVYRGEILEDHILKATYTSVEACKYMLKEYWNRFLDLTIRDLTDQDFSYIIAGNMKLMPILSVLYLIATYLESLSWWYAL